MTVKTNDEQVLEVELTKEEVERAVQQLAYRKLYQKRPEVVAARKRYQRRRNEEVKLAMEAWRQAQKGGVK